MSGLLFSLWAYRAGYLFYFTRIFKYMFFGKPKVAVEKTSVPSGVAAVFWGAGDSMICCQGIAGEGDEFNVMTHPKLQDGGYVATLEITAPGEDQGLFIHAFYSGHWSFAVSPSNGELDSMPAWPIERAWGTINAHSETLKIYCPKQARLSVIDRIEANK